MRRRQPGISSLYHLHHGCDAFFLLLRPSYVLDYSRYDFRSLRLTDCPFSSPTSSVMLVCTFREVTSMLQYHILLVRVLCRKKFPVSGVGVGTATFLNGRFRLNAKPFTLNGWPKRLALLAVYYC